MLLTLAATERGKEWRRGDELQQEIKMSKGVMMNCYKYQNVIENGQPHYITKLASRHDCFPHQYRNMGRKTGLFRNCATKKS